MSRDFDLGWADGVEDARRLTPTHAPDAMRYDVYSWRVYVHSAAYRDGYHLGYAAERGRPSRRTEQEPA